MELLFVIILAAFFSVLSVFQLIPVKLKVLIFEKNNS